MDPAFQRRNRRLAGALVLVAAGMVGLAYASVPLYALFCRTTGFGGTPRLVAAGEVPGSGGVVDRWITVRFNADVNAGFPWRFRAENPPVRVRLGETTLVHFQAFNPSDRPQDGTAVYNVTPAKAGPYFDKIACFCFTRQHLAPHERADLPVAFSVDPALAGDGDLDDVDTITLSYTFFRAN